MEGAEKVSGHLAGAPRSRGALPPAATSTIPLKTSKHPNHPPDAPFLRLGPPAAAVALRFLGVVASSSASSPALAAAAAAASLSSCWVGDGVMGDGAVWNG